MKKIEASGPNAEQISFWNEQTGAKWVSLQDAIDGMIRPLGLTAMERAAVAPGERVLDVGCGCGDTTLELSRRVQPGGYVVGIDISSVMLQCAAEQAQALARGNVEFLNADAQTHRFDGSFDLIFSRFGVMFFADPEAAFRNLRTALKPGGRLAFVCWQALAENPLMLAPLLAALPHIPAPTPPAPGAPGPFAFADADRVRGILDAAGFREIRVDPLQQALTFGVGRSLDEIVAFLLQMGPTGSALRGADDEVRSRVATAVREALGPYLVDGALRVPSATWIFSARA